MRPAALLIAVGAIGGSAAEAQEARPCQVMRVVLESARSLLLRCDQARPVLPAGELYRVDEVPSGDPRVAVTKVAEMSVGDVSLQGRPQPFWKRFSTATGQPAMVKGTKYFLHIPPSAGAPPAPGVTWKPFWQSVATDVEATVTDSLASIDSGRVLMLRTPVALQVSSGAVLQLTEDGTTSTLPATFAVLTPVPVSAEADPEDIGRVDITLAKRLRPGKVKLSIQGLTDALGGTVSVPARSRTEIVGRKLSGRTKDEVGTYIKFAHEAAETSKPAWTIDAKGQVELPGTPGGWRVTPSGTLDIGFGTSKSTNTVKLGVGFTRFDLVRSTFQNPRQSLLPAPEASDPVLQGARVTLAPTLETDRDLDKRNLLADADIELFLKHFYNPIRTQNQRRLLAARDVNPETQADEVAGARFGLVVTVTVGAEVGGALADQTKSWEVSEGDIKVERAAVAEAHGVARLRPKLGILLEGKKVSLDVQGSGRYLLTREQALIQQPDKSYLVGEFEGWHGYAQVTLSVELVPALSLDSTYKVGRQPPQFQRVSTVQTGLAYKF